jgi:hypothetical protein
MDIYICTHIAAGDGRAAQPVLNSSKRLFLSFVRYSWPALNETHLGHHDADETS